jgi:hypothetical protein
MNRKSVSVAFLLFLLFSGIIGGASAQVATPSAGVAPGNVFAYDFRTFWSSTNQTATVPADLVELNKTATIRITITEIQGLMVLMDITGIYENGTEHTSEGMVNILTGAGSSGFGLIATPKLAKYNVVYPYGDVNFTINGTTTRTYPFGQREAAYFTTNLTDSGQYLYAYDSIYFDRPTGVMLELYNERVLVSSPDEKYALLWKIKEMDLKTTGGILDYWPLIVVAVAVVAVLIAVLVYLRRRRGRRRHRRR